MIFSASSNFAMAIGPDASAAMEQHLNPRNYHVVMMGTCIKLLMKQTSGELADVAHAVAHLGERGQVLFGLDHFSHLELLADELKVPKALRSSLHVITLETQDVPPELRDRYTSLKANGNQLPSNMKRRFQSAIVLLSAMGQNPDIIPAMFNHALQDNKGFGVVVAGSGYDISGAYEATARAANLVKRGHFTDVGMYVYEKREPQQD